MSCLRNNIIFQSTSSWNQRITLTQLTPKGQFNTHPTRMPPPGDDNSMHPCCISIQQTSHSHPVVAHICSHSHPYFYRIMEFKIQDTSSTTIWYIYFYKWAVKCILSSRIFMWKNLLNYYKIVDDNHYFSQSPPAVCFGGNFCIA